VPLGTLGPRPDFASGDHGQGEFLYIGDDVAFPVEDGFLLTCVVRGTISPKARERRAEKRRRRSERHAVIARHGFREGRVEVAA
jgi:hypothetical protein